jgi:phage repressor protein C with HTH and peptisase S24 domain
MALVRGRSMVPTLEDGDRLLVRYGAEPEAGRVAVVRFADGVVAVKRLDHRAPAGWWVWSDNALEGRDSSTAGTIAEDDVLAVVLARLWPHPSRVR